MAVRQAVIQGIITAQDLPEAPVDVCRGAVATAVVQMYSRVTNGDVVDPLAGAVTRAVSVVPSDVVLSQVCPLWLVENRGGRALRCRDADPGVTARALCVRGGVGLILELCSVAWLCLRWCPSRLQEMIRARIPGRVRAR